MRAGRLSSPFVDHAQQAMTQWVLDVPCNISHIVLILPDDININTLIGKYVKTYFTFRKISLPFFNIKLNSLFH